MNRLRAMELFVTVAREQSFTKAAKASGLALASVSRYIAELEAELGVQLVARTTRSVTVTEAGALYCARVERILEDLSEADEAASALQTTPRGNLRVHSRTLFGLLVMGPLLPEFQKAYPEIRLEITLSERQIKLREEEFDLDLRFSPAQDGAMMQRKILSSKRILVASPEYLARMPPVEQPSDLQSHQCMAYLLGQESPVWRFMRNGVLTEIAIPSTLEIDNGELLRRLAIMGHGIALLDDFTTRREIAAGQLVQLLPAYKATNTTFEGGIYAVYRQTPYLPQKIRVFLDFLVSTASRAAGN